MTDQIPAVVPVPPPADRAALRAVVVEAVERLHETGGLYALGAGEAERIAAAVLAVLPEQTDRAALLRQEADQIRAHCPDHLDSDSAPGAWMVCHCDVADDMLRRMAAEEQPAETPMFGSPDCTCIPFTRQTNPPRVLNRPTDTVNMISGWEIGRDCPHHKPAVGEQPAEDPDHRHAAARHFLGKDIPDDEEQPETSGA